MVALSRTQVITPTSDNAGFARFVQEKIEPRKAHVRIPAGADLLVYGEWCGPKINKGAAICQIPERVFAVFAARFISGEELGPYIVDPNLLEPLVEGFPNTYVLPWYPLEVEIDWLKDSADLNKDLEVVNRAVAEVEACDPWVLSTFGVSGVGEGLVMYPQSQEGLETLLWKAKGKEHQVLAHTRPAQAEPTKVGEAQAFADLVVTPARLEQGARAVAPEGELTFSPTTIGQFLSWLRGDLEKETATELQASGLSPKVAYAACIQKAKAWYMGQLQR